LEAEVDKKSRRITGGEKQQGKRREEGRKR
jgi:hypothetical protein